LKTLSDQYWNFNKMSETDFKFLREAFAVAQRARTRGNHPFGAILVGAGGEKLLEAENTVITDRDCVGHAETNLLREASRRFDESVLAKSVIYASAEPCVMCAGAIYWSGVGRLVYGLSKKRLGEIQNQQIYPQLFLPCREVFARGQREIAVEGPALEVEAELVHKDYWI
jgi:tRNA(Arg) A34 adenosine deaminase TadA